MWGVVFAKPLMEVSTAGRLAARANPSDVYVPQYHDRLLGRRRPLFPRYFFAASEAAVPAFRHVHGVIALLWPDTPRIAGRLAAIIEALRAATVDGLVQLPPLLPFAVGDSVRITAGPFADTLAIYDGQAPGDRVHVLLSFLGAERRFTLPANDIAAVADA